MRARGAVASSVLDQAVFSLTNIMVLVVAARLSTTAGFAAFSMVYMVFTVLLGLAMAYVGQTVVLEHGGEASVRSACRSATAFTAIASLGAGTVLAAATAFVPGRTAAAFTALGLVLPVVLAQDGTRYCFSALGLPHHALAADSVRLAAAIPALALQPQGTEPARLVMVWGLSALPALLVGAALLRPHITGVPSDVRRFLRRGHLGKRFAVEFAVGNAAGQLAILALGLFANPLAVGALRGASTLFGPLNVLHNSANAFGPPLLNRLPDTRRRIRATTLLTGVLMTVAVLWASALSVLPDSAGRRLLGDTWPSVANLLPATGSQYAAMAAATCALLTLRLLSPKDTLPVQLVFSGVAVACLLAGYAAGGVLGAAWGLCAGSALKAAAAWWRVRALSRHPRP